MPHCKHLSVVVYILVVLFGVASWVDLNSLWVELPILVQKLPEGWNLPSYIVAITQLANIGPILYSLVCSSRLKERTAIFLIIGIGAATCLALVFFWQQTVFLVGAERSVPLFIMNFILACVDCTSTVVFFPFMATFKPAYMSAYFTGEGLGGLLPGLLGLAQGAGRVVCLNETVYNNVTINETVSNNVTINETVSNNVLSDTTVFNNVTTSYPYNNNFTRADKAASTVTMGVWVSATKASYGDNLFSFEVFFSVVSAIVLISGISFSVLVFHPVSKKEHAKDTEQQYTGDRKSPEGSLELINKNMMEGAKDEDKEHKAPKENHSCDEISVVKDNEELVSNELLTKARNERGMKKDSEFPRENQALSPTGMTTVQYATSLLLTGWVNCLRNSVLLSVQSYSCLPYGTTQYHLTVTLSNVANPLACFFNLFCITTSIPALSLMSVISSLLGAYIMVAAAMSPTPVLVGTITGSVLMVSAWVSAVFLLTYVKVTLASLFRTQGEKGLFHCGVATQAGSAVGGVTMFVLVNALNIFRTAGPCS